MKRKNTNIPYCVICHTRNYNAGFGISFEGGSHICMECAEGIHGIIEQWHEEHLEHRACGCCNDEFEF